MNNVVIISQKYIFILDKYKEQLVNNRSMTNFSKQHNNSHYFKLNFNMTILIG